MYQSQYVTRICVACRERIEDMPNPIAIKISIGNADPRRALTEAQMAELLQEMPEAIAAAFATLPNPTFHLCTGCWDAMVVTEEELTRVVIRTGREVREALAATHQRPAEAGK